MPPQLHAGRALLSSAAPRYLLGARCGALLRAVPGRLEPPLSRCRGCMLRVPALTQMNQTHARAPSVQVRSLPRSLCWEVRGPRTRPCFPGSEMGVRWCLTQSWDPRGPITSKGSKGSAVPFLPHLAGRASPPHWHQVAGSGIVSSPAGSALSHWVMASDLASLLGFRRSRFCWTSVIQQQLVPQHHSRNYYAARGSIRVLRSFIASDYRGAEQSHRPAAGYFAVCLCSRRLKR